MGGKATPRPEAVKAGERARDAATRAWNAAERATRLQEEVVHAARYVRWAVLRRRLALGETHAGRTR